MKLKRRVRKLVFTHAGRVTPLVAIERDGLTLLVETWDMGLGRKLFVGEKRKEMRALARAVAALTDRGQSPVGKTLIDVGANIGTTCLPALAWHGFSDVVAIEPDVGNARVLRAAAALSGLEDRVRVVEAAAGRQSGTAAFVTSPRNSGAHRLALPNETGREVPVVSLDDLAAAGTFDPDAVGLVWVDAQGAEADIVEGASELVARRVPIVIEVSADMTVTGYDAWADIGERVLRFQPFPIQRARKIVDVLLV